MRTDRFIRPATKNDLPALRRAVDSAVYSAIRAGAVAYDRARDLPRLIRVSPEDCRTASTGAARTIVARLERALRAERKRARSGHWTYDLNRHIALRQAFLAESERLASREMSAAADRSAAAHQRVRL